MPRTIRRLLSVLALATLMAAPAAMAQYWTPQESLSSRSSSPEFSEAEIRSYARTFVALENLRFELAQQLRSTDDAEEKQNFQLRFQEAATEVLESGEVSHDRYNQITIATQRDQRLHDRVLSRIQSAREARSRR